MSPRHRRSRRGMTLVEVMVAVGILLIMSMIVMQSLRNSIEFHNLLDARDRSVRTARVAMSKIAHDLQLAYLTPNRVAVNTYQTVFVGLDEEPAKLFFATLNHQRLYLNSRECDQAEVTIWAEPSPDRGAGYVLYHRESPRIDQYPDEQGAVLPLAYNVRSFRLRFLDQVSGEWKPSWDTRTADTPYRLPRAVEIGLVLIAPDPEDVTGERTVDVPFLSRVMLEYADRMPNPNQPMANRGVGGQGGFGGAGFGGLSGGGSFGMMGGGGAMGGGARGDVGPRGRQPGKPIPPPGLFEGNPTSIPQPWRQR